MENICTQRNILSLLELPIIDFIKIHKVLLSIHNGRSNDGNTTESIHDSQLQYGIDLVTRYGLTFGSDSNGYNFSPVNYTLQVIVQIQSVVTLSNSNNIISNNNNRFNKCSYNNNNNNNNCSNSNSNSNSSSSSSSNNNSNKFNKFNNLVQQILLKNEFWFNKGSLFAISNINHLIGFGDAKNPFAKLFQLPEALKERKDKRIVKENQEVLHKLKMPI